MTADAPVVVTSRHLRTVPGFSATPGFCVGRSRAWCARYGLDWRAFLREGIPAAQLEATGDALGIALAAHARAVEAGAAAATASAATRAAYTEELRDGR